MIRNFNALDPRRLKANGFSNAQGFEPIFKNPDWYKMTLVTDGSVRAIICFARYWGNCFAAFFLCSKDITMEDGAELKEFVYQAVIDFQAERVQTDSVACPKLTRWHKFLGFKSEGVRVKMVDNTDYEMWAIVKGRDF